MIEVIALTIAKIFLTTCLMLLAMSSIMAAVAVWYK